LTTARKGRKGEPLAARLLREVQSQDSTIRWPSSRYREDPIGFFYDVLGVERLSDDQLAILEAMNGLRSRVSVASGHKTGKDFLAGGIALWWFASDDEARVRATAVTMYQVRDVFWREVCAHWRRSQLGRYPLDGMPHGLPQNGLRVGAREIVGFTSDQPEAAAGISGRRVLYILDEASGIGDPIFEAMKGNLAGGDARVLMLSQPTRNDGAFYDSHHEKRELWKCFTLSSEKTPNVIEGCEAIPGMATREWLAEQALDWNAPDGPVWKVRVKGEFAEGSGQKVIPLSLALAAERRWETTRANSGERLHVGLDVAGTGDDENAIAVRRGQKVLGLEAWSGVSAKETSRRAIQIVRRHRLPREERALVKVDSGGTIGLEVYGELRAYADEIEVVPVHFGAKSPLIREYPLVRDQIWFGLERWLRDGGALPPDRKLPAELTCPAWRYDEQQRRHVEKKDALRKRLKRSTDRADACILAVYEPPRAKVDESEAQAEAEAHDPYGGAASPYGGGIDPYGGA
jgi:hypothetical protein